MLSELKGSSVDMKMSFLLKSLSHVVCHPFQMTSNINRCTINIQDVRNIYKRKAIWDEPNEKVEP
jgi:hypothetical protein